MNLTIKVCTAWNPSNGILAVQGSQRSYIPTEKSGSWLKPISLNAARLHPHGLSIEEKHRERRIDRLLMTSVKNCNTGARSIHNSALLIDGEEKKEKKSNLL